MQKIQPPAGQATAELGGEHRSRRWVIVGAEVAEAILAEAARPPEVDDLNRLIRLLERQAPELLGPVSGSST